jgi:uncharacterized protein
VILTDTGPIIALLDADDTHHQACVTTAGRLPATPLLTPWSCFTEAMYLLGAVGGYRYQRELWRLQQAGRLSLHEATPEETARMAALMATYQDVGMDLADASLMAAAERWDMRQIFTLDSHFFVYRFADGSAPEVIR